MVFFNGPRWKVLFHGKSKTAITGGVEFDDFDFRTGSLGECFYFGQNFLNVFFRNEASVDDEMTGLWERVGAVVVCFNVGNSNGCLAQKFIFRELFVEFFDALNDIGNAINATEPFFGVGGVNRLATKGHFDFRSPSVSSADPHPSGHAQYHEMRVEFLNVENAFVGDSFALFGLDRADHVDRAIGSEVKISNDSTSMDDSREPTLVVGGTMPINFARFEIASVGVESRIAPVSTP